MPNYKIGHIHGIEQNVEVWMQYAYYTRKKTCIFLLVFRTKF
jgi:hypothetical protein